MAKTTKKATNEETLETILFNCRNSLRGRAAMTDKRDLLLTLVFLKFIGERFKQQKEKIRHEIVEVQGIHDEAFVELQLSRPNQYMQDGVFFLTDETFWDKLILTAPTGMAIAFDTANAAILIWLMNFNPSKSSENHHTFTVLSEVYQEVKSRIIHYFTRKPALGRHCSSLLCCLQALLPVFQR